MRNDPDVELSVGIFKVTLAKSKMLKKNLAEANMSESIDRIFEITDENALKSLVENVDNTHEKLKSRNMVTTQI